MVQNVLLLIVASTETEIKTRGSKAFTENYTRNVLVQNVLLLIVASTETEIKTRGSKAFTENYTRNVLVQNVLLIIVASTEQKSRLEEVKPSLRITRGMFWFKMCY